jgi:glycosyltransferase involved in cell wall biosynthesis
MISILLATYNGEKYISLAIESVLNQSFKDFELLIGFNGTTDSSKGIVYRYNDPRIRVFDFGDDKGKSKTLNKLLVESKYDHVCLQDDDDVWLYNKLENQISHSNEYDVVGTLISYINEEGNIIGRPNLSTNPTQIERLSMKGLNQIANTSAIFKKQDALDINGWRDGLDGIEDYDFWLRLMRNGKRFINVPEELVLHRLHSNSNFNTKKYDLSKIL